MVTSGQQAGLFTGPLYTLHKALTAVRLAAELESRLGVLVLPVFWVASEDHDFAEVNHAWSVDGTGLLGRSAVRPTSAVPVPMSQMRLGSDVERALEDFAQRIAPDADECRRIQSALAAYRPGETLAAAFAGALAELLAPFDVCLTDAADPALKQASADVLAGEIEAAAEHERRVAERTAAVQGAGLTPPVTVVEDSTHLFYHGPAGRERLHREGGAMVAREAGERFSPSEAVAAIRSDPVRFSPNVLLRPVVESAVFPTLAYVGGPAETGYFAQIGPLFESFGIRPPVAYPRWAARIVPAEVESAQRELGVDDRDLAQPEHELLDRVARSRVPAGAAEGLASLRRGLVDGFGEVIDASAGLDPTLALALGARRNRALLQIAAAERKILRQLKRGELARSVRLVRNHLRPNGVPQERVLTVFQYLSRDPELLARLASGIRIALEEAAAEPAVGAPVEAAER